MTAERDALPIRPWYREPWPWLLMMAPLAAVAMGILLLVLAGRSNDGLVADDYYKRGLTINQTLDRVDRARTMGLRASAAFNPQGTRVRVVTMAPTGDDLTLRFMHPTRAGMDQTIRLTRTGAGVYEGAVDPLAPGRWHVALEDVEGRWRITGSWLPGEAAARLEPAAGR